MHILRKNEVRICEKVSNNLGQLSSTLPLSDFSFKQGLVNLFMSAGCIVTCLVSSQFFVP